MFSDWPIVFLNFSHFFPVVQKFMHDLYRQLSQQRYVHTLTSTAGPKSFAPLQSLSATAVKLRSQCRS